MDQLNARSPARDHRLQETRKNFAAHCKGRLSSRHAAHPRILFPASCHKFMSPNFAMAPAVPYSATSGYHIQFLGVVYSLKYSLV